MKAPERRSAKAPTHYQGNQRIQNQAVDSDEPVDELNDPQVFAETPAAVKAFRRRAGRQILMAFFFSGLMLAAVCIYAASEQLHGAYIIRFVPGSALLAGFGMVGTLAVAVLALARGLGRVEKLQSPAGADFLGQLCWILLLSDAGLTLVGMAQSIGPAHNPNVPFSVDVFRFVGSFAIGMAIALCASDAADHSRLLEGQSKAFRDEEISEIQRALDDFPPKPPSKTLARWQYAWMFLATPVVTAVIASWWYEPIGVVVWVMLCEIASICAFFKLRGTVWLRRLGRRWSLLLDAVAGVCYWFLLFATYALVILSIAADRAREWDNLRLLEFLIHAPVLYLLAIAFPFYVARILTRQFHDGIERGIVLESTYKRQQDRILKLEGKPTPRQTHWKKRWEAAKEHLSSNSATRKISQWVLKLSLRTHWVTPILVGLLIVLILVGCAVLLPRLLENEVLLTE